MCGVGQLNSLPSEMIFQELVSGWYSAAKCHVSLSTRGKFELTGRCAFVTSLKGEERMLEIIAYGSSRRPLLILAFEQRCKNRSAVLDDKCFRL